LATSVKTLLIFSACEREWLTDGLQLLRNGHFLPAHELFEQGFRARREGEVRTLFHGLAQLAAAYYQLTLGRGRASVRTWQRARKKLAQVDALEPGFADAVDALHAGLGLDADGPRFIDPSRLGSLQSFPVPDQIPSA